MIHFSNSKKITISFFIFFIICCLILLFPPVRYYLLNVIGYIFNKKFEKPELWIKLLLISSVISLGLSVLSIFILLKDEFIFSKEHPNTFFSEKNLNLFHLNNYNKKTLPLHIILFIFLFTIRVITISNKSSLFIDETYSFIISNYNDYGLTKEFENEIIKTGAEYKQLLTCNDPSLKGALTDILNLYKNSRDIPHSNFYYSLLRCWSIGHKTGDMKQLIWIGTSLNLLLFIFSYCFFFFLVKKIFPNDFICLSVLFVAFINTASISNCAFIRPYMLQEVFFILVANLFVSVLNLENKKIPYQNMLNALKISIILSFTLLTGYYTTIYIFIIALIILYITLYKKNYKSIKYWFLVIALTFCFTTLFYPRYFYQLLFSKAMSIVKNVYSLNGLLKITTDYFFYIPFAIVLLFIFFCYILQYLKNKKIAKQSPNDIIVLLILLSAFLWAISIFFITPRKIIRYIMPVFPIFSLLIGYVLNKLTTHFYKSVFSILMMFIFTFGFAFPLNKCYIYSNIDFLDYNAKRFSTFTQDKSKKVCIINNPYWKYSDEWKSILLYADFIEYIDDNQLYFFADSLDSISTMINNEDFYILIETELLQDERFSKLLQFESKEVFSYSIFHIDSFDL